MNNKVMAAGAFIVGIIIGVNLPKLKKAGKPLFKNVQYGAALVSKNVLKFILKQKNIVKDVVTDAKEKVQEVVALAEKEAAAEAK